ncbi:hypothetical protein DQ04_00901100 [Trypanosoma grayi]|uniref:hypothetical protein n=1 Tax=Trypanosoma grayi TaxID=71804 RepID=UPI0004F4A981|nr:hypothetical protein DQ04_00901100 [Trypanosoma grayi]KEG13608.1 hypothetical protein DQ04_00901100 [Trypanosoma grayi]
MALRDIMGAIGGLCDSASRSRGVGNAISTAQQLIGRLDRSSGGDRGTAAARDAGAPGPVYPENTVFLNVYDITEANNVLYHAGLGVHHTGVEVYGMEIAFGRCEEGPGVFQTMPKQTEPHIFREQLVLGETQLTREQVCSLVEEFRANTTQWSGRAYHLIRNNCNCFSEAFAKRLLPPDLRKQQQEQKLVEVYDGGEREEVQLENGEKVSLPVIMPSWVNNLARSATRFLPNGAVDKMEEMDMASQRSRNAA